LLEDRGRLLIVSLTIVAERERFESSPHQRRHIAAPERAVKRILAGQAADVRFALGEPFAPELFRLRLVEQQPARSERFLQGAAGHAGIITRRNERAAELM